MKATRKLVQPKIYSAPKEKEKGEFPKALKIFILLVVILIILAYLLYLSSIFKIKDIKVIGEAPNGFMENLKSVEGQNIFLFNSKVLQDDLARKYSEYSNVKVDRGIPNTLRVSFQERSPSLVWQSSDKRYLMDKNGNLFKKIDDSTFSNLPLVFDNKDIEVVIPSQVASANFVSFIQETNLALESQDLKIEKFAVNETTFQIDAVTSDGFKIIFDTTRPLSDQMDAVKKVFEKNRQDVKEYLDVRVEGWAYFK